MCDGNILFLGVLEYSLFTLHPFTPFLVGWCIVDSSVFRDECDDADAGYLYFSLTLSCVIRISYWFFSLLPESEYTYLQRMTQILVISFLELIFSSEFLFLSTQSLRLFFPQTSTFQNTLPLYNSNFPSVLPISDSNSLLVVVLDFGTEFFFLFNDQYCKIAVFRPP